MRQDQHRIWGLVVAATVLVSGCAAVTKGRADLDSGMRELGTASWYGADFHGSVTANGELYDMHTLTAAHRTLPLGTVARITNAVNGKHAVIRVNDRGPYVNGRILDLSYAAAQALGMEEAGVTAIQLEVVGQDRFETETRSPDESTLAKLSMLESAVDAVSLSDLNSLWMNSTEHTLARMMPTDIRRQRRARRVGDVMAAQRRVELVAESVLV